MPGQPDAIVAVDGDRRIGLESRRTGRDDRRLPAASALSAQVYVVAVGTVLIPGDPKVAVGVDGGRGLPAVRGVLGADGFLLAPPAIGVEALV